MNSIERKDLTITCPFCNKDAKVYERYHSLSFMGYTLHCKPCNLTLDIKQEYRGQIRVRSVDNVSH